MWLLPKIFSGPKHSGDGQRSRKHASIRILLRQRYSKLGPLGDYLPTGGFTSFRIGSFSKSKAREGKSSEEKQAPHGNSSSQVQKSGIMGKRSKMEKIGDAYVNIIWSATSHVARPISAKPKRSVERAVTFEKMFGEPPDDVLVSRSLSSIYSQLQLKNANTAVTVR